MKFYTSILLFLFSFIQLSAQEGIRFTPLEYNASLQSQTLLEKEVFDRTLEEKFGYDSGAIGARDLDDCPEPPDDVVEEDGIIFLPIDTTGLGGGTSGDSIAINNACGYPLFAEDFQLVGLDIRYEADVFDNDDDIRFDTVCLLFYPNEEEPIDLFVPVVLRRKGKDIQLTPQTVGRNTVNEYCLDPALLETPGDLICGEVADITTDNYDGNGVFPQSIFFENDVEETLCFVYRSNNLGGTDQVGMTLCDDFGICDTYVFNFEIPAKVIPFADGDDLVFFEDFAYEGIIPDTNKWADRQVWRNNTAAKLPPSWGVATFDGTDATGTPYERQTPAIGDRLTSHALDLSGRSPDENLFLRFWLQPKGFMSPPEAPDSFYVEMKNDIGEWVRVGPTYPGIGSFPIFDSPDFFFVPIPIIDDEFFHSQFQFRFVNKYTQAGLMDMWHLDQVDLRFNNSSLDAAFPIFGDVAWRYPPNNPLSFYQTMPLSQIDGYEDVEFGTDFDGLIFNTGISELPINNTSIRLIDLRNGDSFGDNNLSFGDNVGSVFSLETLEVEGQFAAGAAPYFSFLENQIVAQPNPTDPDDVRQVFQVEYSFESSGSQLPIFRDNDIVSSYITFDKFLGYDDGSAELQVEMGDNNLNEALGQQYFINENDELTGVRIMFPRTIENVGERQFQIKLYNQKPDIDVDPFYTSKVESIFFPDLIGNGIQQFTTYRFEDDNGDPISIPVVAGELYVTVAEVNGPGSNMAIGYDLSRPLPADSINFLLGNSFIPISGIGSLMINPAFTARVFSTEVDEKEVTDDMFVVKTWPNPVQHSLNIDVHTELTADTRIGIYQPDGRMVKEIPFDHQIDISDLATGIYFIQLSDRHQRISHTFKIVKQ